MSLAEKAISIHSSSYLENPMDGGAWWAAVHGVTKSRTRLSDFTFTFHFSLSFIGEGNGNWLQCSCLEDPRDGGGWWAAVCGVAQSQTWLKRLSSSSRCLLTDEWIRKLWDIYPMEYYLAVKRGTFETVLMKWMNLEPIILSEVIQKDKYCILTHIYRI